MSRFRFRTAFVAIAAASLAMVGSAAVASAAPATSFPVTVSNTSGCAALEKVEFFDGHDHMAEDPTVDAGGCYYGIWNLNTGTWAASNFPTSSPSQSQWIYDGPGENLTACVWAPGNPNWICGPSN